MLYRFATCELDEQLYHLRRDDRLMEIEPKVFDVLAYLLRNRDRVVSKDELLDKLWPGQVVSETALTRCIVAARKAVGDDGTRQEVIETQHGRGYRFIASLTTTPPVVSQTEAKSEKPEIRIRREKEKAPPPNGGLPAPDSELLGLDFDTQTPSPDPLTPLLPPPRRWSRASFVLLGLVLFVSIIMVVQYLSLPLPSTESLAPSPQTALPLPDHPSVVVLPFANMSEDPKQEYFSDGITEDLTSSLSRIPGLFVIARHSAFTYKGKAVKVQEVSREMGVRYVLTGSVRHAGDRVRVTAQLIDAITGGHLWSERYDRPLQDIFAVQDDIVQKIVTNLRVEVVEAEFARVRRIPTDNLTAYDSLLRGSEAFRRFTKEANIQARQMFERAAKLDPHYAQAYVGISATYYMESTWGWSQDPQTLEHALAMGQQAVVLDDSLPSAHGLLGMIYAVKRQYEQAIAESEWSIALDPNSVDSYVQRAEALNTVGRPEEALSAVQQAIRLNPQFSLAVHKQRMPIKDPAVLERHIAALRKAGLK